MSGGGNKKKSSKPQAWEEAGSEFYQESYPTDAEFEAIQRDPRHLATLLPSKVQRVGATIRIRTNDSRRKYTYSRRESTVHRRTSTAVVDVQDAMIPDISQIRSDEQTAWEEIMQIKAMPVPMAQKREMKDKYMNEPNLLLQGYEQFKWKRRKFWRQFESRRKELFAKLELWKGTLKRVEGDFGTGVVSYFLFLKYLLYLNTFICLTIFLFIILPTIILDKTQRSPNATDVNPSTVVLDLIQGTGFMEYTELFYRRYSNETFMYTVGGTVMYYNFPVAYICTTLVCFIVSLLSIVRSAAHGFKDRLVESEGQFYQYCNLVFGGWDFCIHNQKSALIKHQALVNEIRGCIELERRKETEQNRSRNQKIRLWVIRIIVNVICLAVLVGCGTAIYFVFDYTQSNADRPDGFVKLILQFLPSLCIVSFNILIPFVFQYLVRFEDYNPIVVVRMTLIRTVFLRLASIFILYATITRTILEHNIECWENFVGQQIYKLVLTDFVTQIVLTFLVNFPRAFIAAHVQNNFVKLLGEQSFDLPKHVLDVVYSQTLCWLGIFYAPLISFMFMIIFFFLFYIKKFVCLVNSSPSQIIYRASRSKSLFMVVLLISFLSALIPIAISFSEFTPSTECGPFQNTEYVWRTIEIVFESVPQWFKDIIDFMGTAGFLIPAFLLLALLIYYYSAINSANRYMVNVLKNQLIMEGRDKQFLLNRLINHSDKKHSKRKQEGDTHITN